MLHYQGWQSDKKSHSLIFAILSLVILFAACNGHHEKQDVETIKNVIGEMKSEQYVMDAQSIRKYIVESCRQYASSRYKFMAQYYENNGTLLWTDRYGLRPQADSLIARLHQIDEYGFSPQAFQIDEIEADAQRVRNLDFDQSHPAGKICASLEYRLSKAYLRLVTGQRYGFVNPHKAYVFQTAKADTTGTMRGKMTLLYDLPVEYPSAEFYQQAFNGVLANRVGEEMDRNEPTDPLYKELKRRLHDAKGPDRRRILVNMERCRWRKAHEVSLSGRRVVVNIPAFELYAYQEDQCLSMRIGCGTSETRTPLLSSEITYFQVNPEWGIPQSIINKDVARHAGDSSYFAKHRYHIIERATGKHIDARFVTRQMLTNGICRVAQEGGPGNAMGRIVFRFKNNYSVYLHDTSSPGFFANAVRMVSHGCVRIQKPFEFAQYLLEDADEWTLERIRISMGIRPETQRGRDYIRKHPLLEEKTYRLVSVMRLPHPVPIYIVYYTIYPDAEGQLQYYPDVYAYDDAIWNEIKTIS